jgi:hypothetical protein
MGNLFVFSTWNFDVQEDFFKWIMKSNATQAMVKVDGKANLIIVNPFIQTVGASNPSITIIVVFFLEYSKVGRDCHGSCY